MKPIPTKGATHNYGPPSGWSQKRDGPCGVLSVRVQQYGITPHQECISTWLPSDAEIMALARGGVVILSVVAGVQPPVAVSVESRPTQIRESDYATLDSAEDNGVEDEDAGRPLEGQGPVTAEEEAADDALEAALTKAALTHEDNLDREPEGANDGG
jgi:hypothetical protein